MRNTLLGQRSWIQAWADQPNGDDGLGLAGCNSLEQDSGSAGMAWLTYLHL